MAALMFWHTAVTALDPAAISEAWRARDVKATARIRSTAPMVTEGRAKGLVGGSIDCLVLKRSSPRKA